MTVAVPIVDLMRNVGASGVSAALTIVRADRSLPMMTVGIDKRSGRMDRRPVLSLMSLANRSRRSQGALMGKETSWRTPALHIPRPVTNRWHHFSR